ncbi:DUF7344 domain-containing protein [Halanaeroarchaeum sulfurireducens]|uniref:DUF7344 domain-containing protein n=1 Tax=Halanaeroarchaeum sulfurireducens TaxID=1604004 RepID=UPI00067853BF|nr:hypothetical protein [Halanaeroarchaeum sulfurireducens]
MLSVARGGVSETSGPSEDDLFEVLSNRRRRYTVHALGQEAGAVELGAVAERVASWEYDVAESELSYDQRKRVYTALQQSHLPKMDDAGIVAFDKQRGMIEPEPALEEVDVYMDIVQGREIPWSQYYLGLSGVGAALVAAVWMSAWPLTLVPTMGWMTAIVAAFTVSAAIHTYYAKASRIGAGDKPPELER